MNCYFSAILFIFLRIQLRFTSHLKTNPSRY